MSLAAVMDALVALEETAVGSAAPTPILNVYRWWQPNMSLPAVWHWLSPGRTEHESLCTIEDLLNIDVVVGVDPRRHAGKDMVALEEALEAIREPLDSSLYSRSPLGGVTGGQRAKRNGMRTQIETVSQLGVLCLVLPIEVRIAHRF